MRSIGISFLFLCLLLLLILSWAAISSNAQTPTIVPTMAATNMATTGSTPTAISPTNTVAAPTSIPVSTLVPSGSISPFDEVKKSIYSTTGAICGAFLVLLFIFVVHQLLNFAYERYASPELTITSASKSSNGMTEDTLLSIRVYNEFRRLQETMKHVISLLGGRIDMQASKGSLANMLRPALNLEAPFINHSMLKRLEGPNPGDIKLNLGPLQVPSSAVNWRRLLRRRNFTLLVEEHSNGTDILAINYVLMEDKHVRLADSLIANPADPASLTAIVEKVIWAISLNEKDSAELMMSRGLRYLAEFLRNPETIEPLKKAVSEFGKAAQASERWELQASLLEAFALRLSQSAPKETLLRVSRLRERFGQKKSLKTLLTYLLGLASYYTYDPQDLVNAIRYFKEIHRPARWQLAAIAFFPKRRYALYLLAQSNIAIAKAHQMIYEQDREHKKHLGLEVEKIAQTVQHEIDSYRQHLGDMLPEIGWRALNARIVVRKNWRDPDSLNEGLQLSDKALDIAPYALDVKANKGSLKLLAALKKAQIGQDPTTYPEFIEANALFEELEQVEWDPSFVKYRLGIIRRVQGRFEDARRRLQEASGRAQDVAPEYIAKQLAKVESGDTSFTESDIP